jgi:hypothetical protein
MENGKIRHVYPRLISHVPNLLLRNQPMIAFYQLPTQDDSECGHRQELSSFLTPQTRALTVRTLCVLFTIYTSPPTRYGGDHLNLKCVIRSTSA